MIIFKKGVNDVLDVETVLNGLRNEENWKAWGIEGIPSFAMDAILLIRQMDEKLKKYEEGNKI